MSGLGKRLAKKAGKAVLSKAVDKAKRASKHYCPDNPYGNKHAYISHKDSEHKSGGRRHGGGSSKAAVVFYCKYCRFVKP
jgi:DNA integrity scanning protein DisA with diadenylate cyclase activity